MKDNFWTFMNDNFLWICMLVTFVMPMGIIEVCKYQEQMQAMKSGYEQKVDTETKKVIWVKVKTVAEQD